MNAILNVERVTKIFEDCFFTEEELKDGNPAEGSFILCEGVASNAGLNKERLEKHRAEILGMLNELDPKFFEATGGGWSFMQVPFDKHGEQWGEQLNGDMLMVLGQGIGAVELMIPRVLWGSLPGGVPYYIIKGEQYA